MDFVEGLASDPTRVLDKDSSLLHQCKEALKLLYDSVSHRLYESEEGSEQVPLGPLDTMIVDDFDEEQIWQEVHLRNASLMEFLGSRINELKEEELEDLEEDEMEELEDKEEDEGVELEEMEEKEEDEEDEVEEEAEEEEDEEKEEEDEDMDDFLDEDGFGEELDEESKRKKNKRELELLMKPVEDNEEQVSEGEQVGGADGEFIPRVDILDSEDEDDEFDQKGQIKSSFEREQEKMKGMIEDLEHEAVATKNWTMKGEVNAKARPLNSLLEEQLEFEQPIMPAPVITEEITESLEDKIKRRIADALFDDVERKQSKEDFVKRHEVELNQEKSKESLSVLYEKEFQSTPSHSAPNELHVEVGRLYKKICTKLDALSNFYFTPKPPKEEISIVSNVPSISVEEVIPAHVSDASRMAPEEVYKPAHRELKGASELTAQDRKAAYEEKKKQKRKAELMKAKNKALVAKINPGKGNKYAKENALKSLSFQKNVKIISRK